jgi:hypothetical protein
MFTSPEDLDLFKFIYSKYLFCAQILFSFEKGMCFWTFLAVCTAFYYWFLPQISTAIFRNPWGIPGEFMGNAPQKFDT